MLRVQNSFIRLATGLLKYVSARLLHKASRLLYVREILINVDQNHLVRMHANPVFEHTINSARTRIAWDRYKTPKPPDRSTDRDCMMQKNEVTSLNAQPLLPKVVVRPAHGHVWQLRVQSQHGCLVVVFLDATASNNGWTIGKSSHYFATLLNNNCLFVVAIA